MVNQIIVRQEDNVKVAYTLVYTNEKRFGKNKPKEHFDFFLTHMKVHAVIPRKPAPLLRQMQKSSRSMQPMEAYTTDAEIIGDGVVQSGFDLMTPDIKKIEDQAVKEGKIFRLWTPKNGLPVFPGRDVLEFIDGNPKLIEKINRKFDKENSIN